MSESQSRREFLKVSGSVVAVAAVAGGATDVPPPPIQGLIESPWLKVNFDTGNSYLAGEDPYAFLEAVKHKVIHVHAKDISVAQSDKERGKVAGTAVGCACGAGVIDWRRVATILRSVDFQGVLSVECGSEEQAADSLKHLRGVLEA